MNSRKPEYIGPDGERVRRRLRLPARILALAVPLVVALIICVVFLDSLCDYVGPNEYGIKEVRLGVQRGIQEKVYGPGLVFHMPYNRVHRLPKNLQVLELTKDTPQRTRTAAQIGPAVHYDRSANIQTSDGFYVDVDVSILYRISDPYKVVTQLGTGELYRQLGILPKAEPILKESLGQLTTEEIYNSLKRVEKAQLARTLLNEELNAKGLTVDQVLVRYFEYSERIQQNIEEKKLQDQLVFTNQSKRKAAEQEQLLVRVQQEGDNQVKITLEEGQAYKVAKEAEKDLYARKKRAEADLLVKLAEAKRTEMRNEAMQAAGAEKNVAMKMAEVLQGLEVVLLPAGGDSGVNPLDLDTLTEMFGVTVPEPHGTGAPARPSFLDTPLSPAEALPMRAPLLPDNEPAAMGLDADDTGPPEETAAPIAESDAIGEEGAR